MRVRLLETEYQDQLVVHWRAFMLRPEPQKRSLESFRRYTEKWQQVGSEPDSGEFRTWSSDEGPPSHSLPAHMVAKAAARVGPQAFDRIHEDLLKAYFFDSRDISDAATLRDIWEAAGLNPDQFELSESPELREETINEHNEAVRCGANGAPAFRTADNDTVLVGAHSMDLFRRWINKAIERGQ